jgi:hypothetical protein
MAPQEDNDAPGQPSTKGSSVQDGVLSLFGLLGLSIALTYFLAYGEPRFDEIHRKFGVPPYVSEIALWCVALLFYISAIICAWILASEIKAHRLGYKCALLVAVLLTAPVCLAALLIGVPFLWERLNSIPMVAWLIIGFLIWQSRQRSVEQANHKKFLAVMNILTEIRQRVRNIEEERM